MAQAVPAGHIHHGVTSRPRSHTCSWQQQHTFVFLPPVFFLSHLQIIKIVSHTLLKNIPWLPVLTVESRMLITDPPLEPFLSVTQSQARAERKNSLSKAVLATCTRMVINVKQNQQEIFC